MKKLFFLASVLLIGAFARGQGRVVINEYMPWTSNGCGATSEFVELMNYGPGPIDIGCYVITEGDFSITIPPNTILQAGQFYVIAGQSVLPYPCSNIDSTVTADLNWTTCGCTSGPIPTSGNGLFTDGGSASEQIVLFKPDMTVADAVVRQLPGEVNNPITSSNIGGCTSHSFDMDTMAIVFEELGMSAGRANSFARKLDGDCGWVKDPQQSAHATNNTPGDASEITYIFSYDQSEDCTTAHGSISITVRHADVNSVFPINWMMGYDSNNNGGFDFGDLYTEGYDSTPPNIFISGLVTGRYRITLATNKGCGLKSFDFIILPCQGVLPVTLDYFNYNNNGTFAWKLSETADIASMNLERLDAQKGFVPVKVISPEENSTGAKSYSTSLPPEQLNTQFRMKILLKDGKLFYSQIINLTEKGASAIKHWPDPVKAQMQISIPSAIDETLNYQIFNQQGIRVTGGSLQVRKGTTLTTVQVQNLPPGVYYFTTGGTNPGSFRFVKQ